VKQIAIIALIAAALVSGIAVAATQIDDLDSGTVATHGG
jgi:hypothetical protein